MAPPGRKPTPKELRLLKNDKAHAHRYADKEEPRPSDGIPIAPDYLSERAKEIFTDFVERISAMYNASETDMDIMVLYANNKEQLESYELTLRTEGSTFEGYVIDREGEAHLKSVRARPEIAMLKECKSVQMKILAEFGLSPSSRCRINLKPKKKEKKNPFDAIPGGKKKAKG
ncbi:P27 family phage terminase small subunit [Candidatus Pacearchaeota archaeon]|nr:P27 family phage terminase small subunit [Candidatus Pacearchaeota archaeon]